MTEVNSGTAAVFNSGNVFLRNVSVADSGGAQPQLTRQEYAQLGFTRGGVAYVADGFVQFDFDAQGRLSSGSGVVTLSANGQAAARVRATSGGYAVEIVDPLPGVTAQAARRVNLKGVLKPAAPALRRPAQGTR